MAPELGGDSRRAQGLTLKVHAGDERKHRKQCQREAVGPWEQLERRTVKPEGPGVEPVFWHFPNCVSLGKHLTSQVSPSVSNSSLEASKQGGSEDMRGPRGEAPATWLVLGEYQGS